MKEYLTKVTEGADLTRDEAFAAMRMIMEGEVPDVQIAAFLAGLKTKGEQPEELLGFTEVMREKSIRITLDDPNAIDMCGTGGDGLHTFNISTTASFVVAGAGVTVAKHGNRSISSACGSADLLQSLGVRLEMKPEAIEDCINKIGIGFMFAPMFHPAMKHAAKTRKELGIKTCFNLLGPLTNPAGVRRQLAGVYDRGAAVKIASVFASLPTDQAFVITSHDGMDEISLSAPTIVNETSRNQPVRNYEITPSAFGFQSVPREEMLGGSAETNSSIALRVLNGERSPQRDVVLANATYGILVAGKSSSIEEALASAAESIDSGRALAKLKQLVEISHQ